MSIKNKKLYIIACSDFQLNHIGKNVDILAMTSSVMAHLDNAGISYLTLKDFVSRSEAAKSHKYNQQIFPNICRSLQINNIENPSKNL